MYSQFSTNVYELSAIAGWMISGVRLSEGMRSAIKTLVGMFTLAISGNIKDLLTVPNYPQIAIKDVIITLAVPKVGDED